MASSHNIIMTDRELWREHGMVLAQKNLREALVKHARMKPLEAKNIVERFALGHANSEGIPFYKGCLYKDLPDDHPVVLQFRREISEKSRRTVTIGWRKYLREKLSRSSPFDFKLVERDDDRYRKLVKLRGERLAARVVDSRVREFTCKT